MYYLPKETEINYLSMHMLGPPAAPQPSYVWRSYVSALIYGPYNGPAAPLPRYLGISLETGAYYIVLTRLTGDMRCPDHPA